MNIDLKMAMEIRLFGIFLVIEEEFSKKRLRKEREE